MTELTVNELFSGIGSQRAALERLHIPHRIVGIAEIDKYAIASYEAIYGKTRNYGDISVVDKLDYADFWTYSFPCTDISVAGKQEGIIKGKTRSGLLYEVQRLLETSQKASELPKYLMLENVKNLVGKQFKPQFDEWISWLDNLGYNTYYKVLNAKDYGVPQNRERVFAISIRKDIDDGGFKFPQPFNTGIRLKDILEKDVDEKYYLSENIQKRFKITDETMTKSIIGTTIGEECTRFGQRDVVYQENCTIGTLAATDYKQPKQILEITSEPFIVASRGRYINENESNETYQNFEPRTDGLTNTITTVQKDNYIVNTNRCVQVGDLQHYGYDEMNRVCSKEGLCPTLRTMIGGDRQPKILNDFQIRKLTPKECWRLMGFFDEAFDKADTVCSNSQLYKQAGNSIVVDVLYYIFKNLFKVGTDEILHTYKRLNSDYGENKLLQLGNVDKPEWRESRRRVYSENGISPTLHGIGCGGNTEPKIAIIDDMYANREPRVYKEYSPTLRSERQGLKVFEE